jgi:HTH-type transcriptional regulator/antitoxin HigA
VETEVKPIKTEAHYQHALREIERLLDAPPNTPESDRLELLSTLVEVYEDQHFPIPEPDPVDAILYHMESRGLTQADLVPYLGSLQRVNEVLRRRRALTISNIRKLHTGLGISADVLIRPYRLERQAA